MSSLYFGNPSVCSGSVFGNLVVLSGIYGDSDNFSGFALPLVLYPRHRQGWQ